MTLAKPFERLFMPSLTLLPAVLWGFSGTDLGADAQHLSFGTLFPLSSWGIWTTASASPEGSPFGWLQVTCWLTLLTGRSWMIHSHLAQIQLCKNKPVWYVHIQSLLIAGKATGPSLSCGGPAKRILPLRTAASHPPWIFFFHPFLYRESRRLSALQKPSTSTSTRKTFLFLKYSRVEKEAKTIFAHLLIGSLRKARLRKGLNPPDYCWGKGALYR